MPLSQIQSDKSCDWRSESNEFLVQCSKFFSASLSPPLL